MIVNSRRLKLYTAKVLRTFRNICATVWEGTAPCHSLGRGSVCCVLVQTVMALFEGVLVTVC